ncbi:uncharacterized protein N7498_010920 [Penicillium cinerascens]|uniref:Uncharacterized protein n=1 Tax=Penicillium cinerascens TaxID=70096 RepID=A0A9W9M7C9_9EURO|nr:uncharacterized protein N7498_010920 [Penicillium cinerascens]KAJ5191935.1 hypothetical protein N7498_010920 [Penicillium cinerascens]
MLQLSSVVAIAASAAAIFVVFSVVGIVVWVRVRKERHALRLLRLKQGQYARSTNTFTGNTLTELSHEEGHVLGTHGQLPYGKPGEWGQLTSRESLVRKNNSDPSFPLIEKARSLRHSISRTRSRRLSRFSKHSRLSSMATVDETVIHHPISPPRISKDDIPLSAVEGVLELPAERTPRHTPEMNQDNAGFHLGMRPVSPGWPFPSQKERSGLFPVLEDRNSQEMFDPPPRVFEELPQRIRGNSICSQSAGIAPDDPIPPPPPAAFPTDRMSYARNDSVMRLSSMSLDTTNSSILDDGRNGPGSADTDLTSPIFPSGGTFVPFSANDVGKKDGRRSFIAANTNTAMPPLQNFPVRSSSTAEARKKSSMDWISPRRSMTTTSRNPSSSSQRWSGPPCRSDSLSSNPPSRNASLRSGTPVSIKGFQMLNSINWRSSGSQNGCVPHFSQFQQPTVYENEQQHDPFYGGSPQSTGTLFSAGSPGQTISSSMPPSTMQRSSLSQRGPLTSALKSANSQRKGHRRQNCVRISIHPPMTFTGPAFSPTVEEEPEDIDQMEEVDLRESTINAKSLPALPANTTSPVSLSKGASRRNKAQPSTLGPLAEEPQSHVNKSSSKKRKQSPSDALDTNPLNKHRDLPGLDTALPPDTDDALTHTPSPSRIPPLWELPEAPLSSYENSPGTGSPRRSAVKGPRSQPPQAPRAARSNSARSPSKASIDPFIGPGLTSGLPLVTGTQGSDWRKSTDSLHRAATDASDGVHRRDRNSQGSLAGGLGPLPASPMYGVTTSKGSSTVRDRVTIWEDANRGGSPPKPPATHLPGTYTFPDNVSPTHAKNSTPRSLCKNSSPTRLNGQQITPTPASARRGMTTPTGKALGLGIGAATPMSLYDGEGFLRE